MWLKLHPELKSEATREFENGLVNRVVGQERAVRQLVRLFQTFTSGLSSRERPLATLLLLGPTGCGKTHLAESMAEILYGKTSHLIKVNCAEFQREHEVAKLIGSPPGYIGHRETEPKISQKLLDVYSYKGKKIALVLFDEIEKASRSIYDLLLGIMDKGEMTLGTNEKVSFRNSVVFLTSNLGSKEVSTVLTGGIGFNQTQKQLEDVDQDIYRIASDAAKKHFSAEFINRLDRLIVFRPLQHSHMEKILTMELNKIQRRIVESGTLAKFVFSCKPSAREFLLKEGFDIKYGARHLKRAVEKYLVAPFGNLLSTGQIGFGDMVEVSYNPKIERLEFRKRELGAVIDAVIPKAAKGRSVPVTESDSEIFLNGELDQ